MPPISKTLTRSIVIAGNWKMYKTVDEALNFIKILAPLIGRSQARVYLAVPFTAIQPTVELVNKLKAPLIIGAQNMNDASEGAFTGEIAARMLKGVGAQFVILGHSERRRIFNESNEFINKKVKRALEEGIQPILCVGETQEERAEGMTEGVLRAQLLSCLEGVTSEDLSGLILAYEPVWAIGTGKVASAADAQEAHHFIRHLIEENWDKEVADRVVIQYGGSVQPENAEELLMQPDVDGLLIGGASLLPETFSEIINGSNT